MLRYFEKENVIVSDCYALDSGTIHYEETDRGDIIVKIGGREYQYNPLCMYYFPEGATVSKYDRICSGVENMPHVISELGGDINTIYLIFRKQLYTLTDSDFSKTGVTTYSSTQEEIIELLFAGLTKVTYDPKTAKINEIEYQGTQQAVLNRDSFYTALSYGYSSRIVDKALKGDIHLEGDVMTNTILGLLLQDQLDVK